MIKNQKTFNNFTYNTKCNIWRISFNNTDKEYDIRNYCSDEYNITPYNNSNTYNGICINELNMYYGELCAMYYVWKNNLKSDIVGFDQYAKQWNYIDFENINKNKIQVYTYWSENRSVFNESNHNDIGEFLYDMMIYIKFHYPIYNDKIDYILFKHNEIRNHINIFICKWEIFEQICNIVFGFLEHIMPNNQWQNKNVIDKYIEFNFNVYKSYKWKDDSLNMFLLNGNDTRYFICCLEVVFGSIYNIISESFESGNIVKSYVSYDCNSIDDYFNIIKMYKYNIGNGVKLMIINDPNNITENIREPIYNNLCVKTNDKFIRLGWFCDEEHEYEYIVNNYNHIKLNSNQYIYTNSIEFNKGNYIIKTIE